MKLAARVSLALVLLLAGLLLLPRPAARVFAPDAYGQVPPTLPTDLLSPTASPTRTAKPKPPKPPTPPDPEEDPKDPKDDPKPNPRDNAQKDRNGAKGDAGKGPGRGSGKKNKDAKKDDKADLSSPRFGGKYSATGEFDTNILQLAATKLRARGVSPDKIIQNVYTPFIIAGPAAWTDTWGAPRYGPGPIVRTHEGQDVFCKYGDPVLATEEGKIEFGDGGLGGRVARLHKQDGSYWYYAHLSGWNTKEFSNGDQVAPGDVIGYCGNTGNAITTPPHVHFGWYRANGQSANPMGQLVRWLRTAERNANNSYEKAFGQRLKDAQVNGSRRLFGDSFAPDISELRVSSEALIAAASSPGSGAFGLAEVALQAALASQTDRIYDPSAFASEGAGQGESHLAELLQSTGNSSPASDSSD